jgi:hypothetical protein
MQLFELKDHQLTFSPQALGLKPFKDLWTRDKKKDKLTAIGELCFIFYFADGRSDFNNILNEDERTAEILEQVGGLPPKWKIDAKVQVAIDFYRERTKTISSILLEDAEHAATKLSKFLRNVDLEERDEKGSYVNDAKKIADTLKTIPVVVDTLQETKKKVQKELQQKGNARGSIEKGTFEDGID